MSDAYVDVTLADQTTSRAFLLTNGLRVLDFGSRDNAFVTLDNGERALLAVVFGVGGGTAAVTPDHIFESVAARDAYFDSPDPHLDELLIGTPIIVNVGTPSVPDVRFQVWSGANQPSTYPSPITTEWADAGNTSLTAAQIQLLAGLGALTDGQIPQKQGDTLEKSSLVEGSARMVSSKPIQAPEFFGNTGSIFFGDANVTFAGAGLELFDPINNRQCGIIAKLIGQERPEEFLDTLAERTADINLLSDENFGSFDFDYTISNESGRDGVRAIAFTIIPHEAGSGTFIVRKDNQSGPPFVSATVMDILAGQIGSEVRITLQNAFRGENGDTVHVSYSGNAVRGSTIATVQTPYLKVHFQDFTKTNLARTTDVDTKEDDLGAPSSDGQFLSSTVAGVRSWADAPTTGTDVDAIHDNVAGEINAVTEKATPVAADVILIEDSADGFTKKRISLTNLLGGGSAPTPQPGPNDFRYGLSQQSDPALVDFLSLTDVGSPTDPQTVTTGATTQGDYFHIFSANTHDVTRINESALGNVVYADPPIPGQTNVFTKQSDVRTEFGVTYDSYTIGPLIAVPSEDYVVRFS